MKDKRKDKRRMRMKEEKMKEEKEMKEKYEEYGEGRKRSPLFSIALKAIFVIVILLLILVVYNYVQSMTLSRTMQAGMSTNNSLTSSVGTQNTNCTKWILKGGEYDNFTIVLEMPNASSHLSSRFIGTENVNGVNYFIREMISETKMIIDSSATTANVTTYSKVYFTEDPTNGQWHCSFEIVNVTYGNRTATQTADCGNAEYFRTCGDGFENVGRQQLTTPAGVFDTTMYSYETTDNLTANSTTTTLTTIWIAENIPVPIRMEIKSQNITAVLLLQSYSKGKG